MTIAALGPKGTFSCELAEKIKEKDEDIILLPTIRDVFSTVIKGGIRGIVPVENSEAGGVGETLDGLLLNDCKITAEYYMPIRHFFASRYPKEEIAVVYTHPQSHEQCSTFLGELKGVQVIHTSSNSKSAEEAKSKDNSAAVTTISAAGLYKLPILKEDIQNSGNNTTRFLEISSESKGAKNPEKCSIIIIPKDNRPGLLYSILEIFAQKEINLTRIESRPSKTGIGRYVFFIDFETTDKWEDAIFDLKAITRIKELGYYRKKEI